MTVITSPTIAGGLRQRSKLGTEKHGEAVREKPNRKIAADLYPFEFIAVKAKAKKEGGGWSVEEF